MEQIKRVTSRAIISLISFLLVITILQPQITHGAAHNPNDENHNYGMYFWKDERPDLGFYINAAASYTARTVPNSNYGTLGGEWSVMNLLRGKYTGFNYINLIDDSYFDTYLDNVESYVISKNGILDRNKSTEWSRGMLTLTALDHPVTNVGGYNFIQRLSESHRFSFRQGINGPIWELIAMNTGRYDFYTYEELLNMPRHYGALDEEDINTAGKMIDYIVLKEIKNSDTYLGGWSLFGPADPDITGMALQALAPYYLDKEMYEASGALTPYNEFQKAVERGVYTLKQLQMDFGGYAAFGTANAESTVQAIVALTELQMDPIGRVELPNLGTSVNFKTIGGMHDGIETTNMIDALLLFWAQDSYVDEDNRGNELGVGGFKHITSGFDGGGGAGTGVNAMATDQALYGLIAYHRYLNGENSLYNMIDMIPNKGGTSHKVMLADMYNFKFIKNNEVIQQEKVSPYQVIKMPGNDKNGNPIAEYQEEGKKLLGWSTDENGEEYLYKVDEYLSIPGEDKGFNLYAQYELIEYQLKLNLNGGELLDEINIPETYTVEDETIVLPTSDEIIKEGFSFEGWYNNSKFEGEPLTEIAKGTHGDLTLYAKWEEVAEVDKSELESLLNEAESLDTTGKTEESIAKLTEAIETGKSVLADEEATQEDVDEAVQLIEEAIERLEDISDPVVDKSELNKLIEEADSINLADYTIVSAEAVRTALEEAKNVSTNEEATQEDVNKAYETLEKAIDALVVQEEPSDPEVNKSELEAMLTQAESLDTTGKTEESIAKLTEAIESGKFVLTDEEATQEEVDAVIQAIEKAIEGLEDTPVPVVDKTKLNELIDEAESLDLASYTEESVNALLTALADAKVVLAHADATEEDVDQAYETLEKAIEALVEQKEPSEPEVNKSELESMLTTAVSLDTTGKTEESIAKLTEVIESGKSVLVDKNATQEEVDEAVQAIEKAIESLEDIPVPFVDKTKLTELIEKAESLDLASYTNESTDALLTTLAEAKVVSANSDVTQDDVDQASATLEKAIEALVEQEEPNEPEVNKSKLEEMLKLAEALDTTGKTEESIAKLTEAIESGKSVLANDEATQDEVDQAIQAIKEATENLEDIPAPDVNTEALEKALAKANRIDQSKFTEQSIKQLQEAIKVAEEVLADKNMTQAVINDALKQVENAIAGLKEVKSKKRMKPEKQQKPSEKPSEKPLNNKGTTTEKPIVNKGIITDKKGDGKSHSPTTNGKTQQQSETGTTNTVESKTDDTKQTENLPKTATQHYNLLFVGLTMLVFGMMLAYGYRKKNHNMN